MQYIDFKDEYLVKELHLEVVDYAGLGIDHLATGGGGRNSEKVQEYSMENWHGVEWDESGG